MFYEEKYLQQDQFDALTRVLAKNVSRRQLLRILITSFAFNLAGQKLVNANFGENTLAQTSPEPCSPEVYEECNRIADYILRMCIVNALPDDAIKAISPKKWVEAVNETLNCFQVWRDTRAECREQPCGEGKTCCSGVCVNLHTSADYCGSCYVGCSADYLCVNGNCCPNRNYCHNDKEAICCSDVCWQTSEGKLGCSKPPVDIAPES